MRTIYSFAAGGLFGAGLLISDMVDTAKVQGWLDFLGHWNPALAFVMGGAILPMLLAWRIADRRGVSVLGSAFPLRPKQELDRRLIVGSVLFGAGWGLVGLCPGPAIASLTFGGWQGALFVAAMIAGMVAAVPIKSRMVVPT